MATRISRAKRQILGTAVLFLLPALLLYLVLVIWPILYSTYLSFTNWDGVGAYKMVGLRNYIYLSGNRDFLNSAKNTMVVTVLSMLLQVPIGLTIAYLLFRTRNRIYKVYRAVYFLPVVIASTAIGTMFKIIMNNDIGVFNAFVRMIGLGNHIRPWLSDKSAVLYVVVFVQIWQFIGTYVIIFLAAMQSIDASIFESALIDGANAFQQFTLITCPLVKATIFTSLVLCFTGSMKSFDIPFIMTAGGPGTASSYLGNYMYKAVFSSGKFGRGSAVAVVIMMVSFAFTLIFNAITRERSPKGGALK